MKQADEYLQADEKQADEYLQADEYFRATYHSCYWEEVARGFAAGGGLIYARCVGGPGSCRRPTRLFSGEEWWHVIDSGHAIRHVDRHLFLTDEEMGRS